MLIATFGPTTAWVGKTIMREGDAFILEDHGAVSAKAIMEYDAQGHLVWTTDGARAWVGSLVSPRVPFSPSGAVRGTPGGPPLEPEAHQPVSEPVPQPEGGTGKQMADELIGRTLGRYEITALIGRGGMATVYRATHPGLRQTVAVKVLHAHLADDPDLLVRFEREAQAVAALRHPNIVRVIDFDHIDEQYFMVMEYVEGRTLAARLGEIAGEGRRMPAAEVLRTFEPLCAAVDYAHGEGMVHRDVKPANVLLTARGEPVLTDYGIARIVGVAQHTATGTVMGSAHYMSPEQAQGLAADGRSDLYALGVMLFEALAGRVPYEADSLPAVLFKHLTAPVPAVCLLNPALLPPIDDLMRTALAKDPDGRFQTGQALAAALREGLGPLAAESEAAAATATAPERPPTDAAAIEAVASPPAPPLDATRVEAPPSAPPQGPRRVEAPPPTAPPQGPIVGTPPRSRTEGAPRRKTGPAPLAPQPASATGESVATPFATAQPANVSPPLHRAAQVVAKVLARRRAMWLSALTTFVVIVAAVAVWEVTTSGPPWQVQKSGTAEPLTGVVFIDAKHGWVVGSNGTILATTNGGSTWSAQTSGSGAYLRGVAFSDASHGWAVGDNRDEAAGTSTGVILATTNGGATWGKQSPGTAASLTDVAFTDAKHGWVVDSNGNILATADGGATWKAQRSGGSASLTAVAFSDATHGWAVGDNRDEATGTSVILATTNGGATWTAQNPGIAGHLTDVVFSDATHGWAASFNSMLATTDGGATWKVQSSWDSAVVAAVSFSDATHGSAVGVTLNRRATSIANLFTDGVILATTNGGASWSKQSPGTAAHLTDVAFTDAKHGWAVGEGGTILVTTSGGK